MPNRFPYLKSQSDPLGLVEQLGAAATVDPQTDPSLTADRSWFGRMLETGGFSMIYTGDTGLVDTISSHKDITDAYVQNKFIYTAYDWELTSLSINLTAKTGVVQGGVRLKGRCDLFTKNKPEHSGDHTFEYQIARGTDGKWRVTKWLLTKPTMPAGGGNTPLSEFLDRDL